MIDMQGHSEGSNINGNRIYGTGAKSADINYNWKGNDRRVRRRRRKRSSTSGNNKDEDGENDGRRSKRRRRCRISLYGFQLFVEDGKVLDGKKEDLERSTLTVNDEEKFEKSISDTPWCIYSLKHGCKNAPFIMYSGGRRRDQKFICVATTHMKRIFSGGKRTSVILSSF